MHNWQIYVWVFSAVLVLCAIGRVILYFKKPDLVGPLDLVESAVGLMVVPALLGFAYQRAYGPHAVWIVLSVILTALSIYQFFTPKMKKLYEKGWLVSSGTILLQTAVGGPALYAVIRYTFLEPAMWRP